MAFIYYGPRETRSVQPIVNSIKEIEETISQTELSTTYYTTNIFLTYYTDTVNMFLSKNIYSTSSLNILEGHVTYDESYRSNLQINQRTYIRNYSNTTLANNESYSDTQYNFDEYISSRTFVFNGITDYITNTAYASASYIEKSSRGDYSRDVSASEIGSTIGTYQINNNISILNRTSTYSSRYGESVSATTSSENFTRNRTSTQSRADLNTTWVDINGTTYVQYSTEQYGISDHTTEYSTISSSSTSGITTYSTSIINTNSGNIILQPYRLYPQYPYTTSSAVQSTIYNGASPATRRFIGYSNSTFTISNASARTTASFSDTTTSSQALASSALQTTVTRTIAKNVTSWNGATTVLSSVSATQTTSTFTLTNLTVTSGQTFLLYNPPEILSSYPYFQKHTVIAEAVNREILWLPNGNDITNSGVVWSSGQTATSYAVNGYDGYSSFSDGFLTTTFNLDSEGIPESSTYTTTYSADSNRTSTYTTTSQFNATVFPSSTVTVLSANATGNTLSVQTRTTAYGVNTRINTITVQNNGTSATPTTLQRGFAGITTRTINGVGTSSLEALVHNGTTFTNSTYHNTYLITRTIETTTTTTIGSGSGSFTSSTGETHGVSEYYGISYSSRQGISSYYLPNAEINFSYGPQISWRSLSYLGLRGQNPSTSLGVLNSVQTNIGNNGATLFYPFKAYVDGSKIVTPVVFPVTTSTNLGATSYTYSYTSDSILVSTANSTTSSTRAYSLGQATANSSFVMDAQTTTRLVGNNEKWANDIGIITIGVGPINITREIDNTTTSESSYLSRSSAIVVTNSSQYAFESSVAATNTNTAKTTSIGSTVPRNYGIVIYATT